MTIACSTIGLSLNAAAALSGRSVRTWQRRVEEGAVQRLADGRALVPADALQPLVLAALSAGELQWLEPADSGDARAQAQVGALLALSALQPGDHGEHDERAGACLVQAALYFLEQAAQQGEAGGGRWLGLLHAAGLCGDAAGEALALMWLARAATHGHALAREQLAGLMPR